MEVGNETYVCNKNCTNQKRSRKPEKRRSSQPVESEKKRSKSRYSRNKKNTKKFVFRMLEITQREIIVSFLGLFLAQVTFVSVFFSIITISIRVLHKTGVTM